MDDKETIMGIADAVLEMLKSYELPVWQAKEVLLFARDKMEKAILK